MERFANRAIVEIGAKYDRLLIIEDMGSRKINGVRRTIVKAMCDCGKEYVGIYRNIKTGEVSSCGCKRRDMARVWGKERGTKHGKSHHLLMGVWSSMMQRCYNKNDQSYIDYGARGVTVCDEWHKYEPFYNWAISNGWDRGLQLDKDISGGIIYSPSACKFVTRSENNRHTRRNRYITYQNETLCMTDWAAKLGITYGSLQFRIKNWPFNKAMSTPKTR